MPMYRVFFIDRDDHISRPPEVIECADDNEATDKALGLVDGHDVEVWGFNRLVVRIPRNSSEEGASVGDLFHFGAHSPTP
jgi:hypothetical protein